MPRGLHTQPGRASSLTVWPSPYGPHPEQVRAKNLHKQSIQNQLLHWQRQAAELEEGRRALSERSHELSAKLSSMQP